MATKKFQPAKAKKVLKAAAAIEKALSKKNTEIARLTKGKQDRVAEIARLKGSTNDTANASVRAAAESVQMAAVPVAARAAPSALDARTASRPSGSWRANP